MKNKRALAYWCVNVGVPGWGLLEYARGTQLWIVALSALCSLLVLNGVVWFVSRRIGSNGDEASESRRLGARGASPRRRIAFWCGVILMGLGAIRIGLEASKNRWQRRASFDLRWSGHIGYRHVCGYALSADIRASQGRSFPFTA
jgi:hypothetical protein